MIKKALDKYDVKLESSLLIGDKDSDIECAENAGIKGILHIKNNCLSIHNIDPFKYKTKVR